MVSTKPSSFAAKKVSMMFVDSYDLEPFQHAVHLKCNVYDERKDEWHCITLEFEHSTASQLAADLQDAVELS
jgi:hypothetical protein